LLLDFARSNKVAGSSIKIEQIHTVLAVMITRRLNLPTEDSDARQQSATSKLAKIKPQGKQIQMLSPMRGRLSLQSKATGHHSFGQVKD
jgi:hypothetical protein